MWAAYRRLRSRPAFLAAAAIALLVVHAWVGRMGGRWFDLSDPLLVLASGLGVMVMLEDGPRRTAVGRVLAPFGLISYGLYLWHAVIRSVLDRHALDVLPAAGDGLAYWPLHAAMLLALTVPFALASWLLVERPLLRWTGRRAAPVAPPPPPPVHLVTVPLVRVGEPVPATTL